MTVIEDRPQMGAEEFERIAAAAEREYVRMEFLHGKPGPRQRRTGTTARSSAGS